MKCFFVFFLITFSNTLFASCEITNIRNNVKKENLKEGDDYVESVPMHICHFLVDVNPVTGQKYDSPIMIFKISPIKLDSGVKFRHRVRVSVSGAAHRRCLVGQRGHYFRDRDYYPNEGRCRTVDFVPMKFNFQRNGRDSSDNPMLIIFKMDISQVTSDKYIDLKIGHETILNQVIYFEYEQEKIENTPDSCSIKVYGDIGGMIFIDEPDKRNKTFDVHMHAQGRRRLKLISNSNSPILNGKFEGYAVEEYNNGRMVKDSVWEMNADHTLTLAGFHALRLAPKYNYNKSDLPPGDYITTLEIVCE
ncbi:hypothetical protein [Vibrio hepatarius]|uniref:hypothetical protein n=1 Tax=Vibrio hepatarius TaxID=171383 RepID=UPI001C08DE7E|nr:hypothetical protein [Vibrio hepatarius]MBU2896242.1 hypothetical protein [Vibrio hepatarius]